MPYRDIICFANSEREGGRCFAGKDVKTGEWIRPIGKKSDAITIKQQTYKNHSTCPKLLDIVRVPLEPNRTSNPSIPYQTENYRISGETWEHIESATWEDAKQWVDDETASLWGLGDRVPKDWFARFANSLVLIELSALVIIKRPNIKGEEKFRGVFQYAGYEYDLSITDLEFKKKCNSMSDGDKKRITENMLLCVSLGAPFNNATFKLVAGVITP